MNIFIRSMLQEIFVLPMRVSLKFSDKRHLTIHLKAFMTAKMTAFILCLIFLKENRAIKNCVKQSLKYPSFLQLSRSPINGLMICSKTILKPILKKLCGAKYNRLCSKCRASRINLTENSILRLKDDEKLQDAVEPLLVGDLAYFSLVQLKFVSSSWDEIRQAIFSFETGRMKSPKGYKDNPIKISVSSNRDEVKETVKKLQSLFFWSEEDARHELSQLHRFISTLFTLVRAYDKKLSELKAKKNILSFAILNRLL